VENGPYTLWASGTLTSIEQHNLIIPFLAALRSPSATYKTSYVISARFQSRSTTSDPIGAWEDTLSDNWYNVYALDCNGNRIATGVHNAVTGSGQVRSGTFDNVAAGNICWLEIEVTSELKTIDDVEFTYFASAPDEHQEYWNVKAAYLYLTWQTKVYDEAYPGREHHATIIYNGGADPFFDWYEWWHVQITHSIILSSSGTGGSPCGGGHYSEMWSVGWTAGPTSEFYLTNYSAGECVQEEYVEAYSEFDIYTGAASNSGVKFYPKAMPRTGWTANIFDVYGKAIISRLPSKRIIFDSMELYNICSQ
jgi:hypothetical protein